MTRSNPSRRIAAARTRAVVSASEPRKASSEIKTPLDAPMARALRTASTPRSGPIETTVTSPPCDSASCNPASTPNSSPGSRTTSTPSRLSKCVVGSSWPVVLGSGICLTQTTTFMRASVSRLGIETLTHLRPNARIGATKGAGQRSEIDRIGQRNTHRLGLRGGQKAVQGALIPAPIGDADDPVVVSAAGKPRLPGLGARHRLDSGVAEVIRPHHGLAVERRHRPPRIGPASRRGMDQRVQPALFRGSGGVRSRPGQHQDSLARHRVATPGDRTRLDTPALGRAAIQDRSPAGAEQATVAFDARALHATGARRAAHVFDDRSRLIDDPPVTRGERQAEIDILAIDGRETGVEATDRYERRAADQQARGR